MESKSSKHEQINALLNSVETVLFNHPELEAVSVTMACDKANLGNFRFHVSRPNVADDGTLVFHLVNLASFIMERRLGFGHDEIKEFLREQFTKTLKKTGKSEAEIALMLSNLFV